MKKVINKIIEYILILFVLLSPILVISIVRADSGWDSSYDSGGYSSGGSYSSGGYSGSSGSHSSSSSNGVSGLGSAIFYGIVILIYAIAEIEKAISRKVILKQDEIIEEKFGSLDDIDDEEYNQYFKNISKKELKDILTKTYSNLLLEKDNISLLKNICTEQMLENLNELTEINKYENIVYDDINITKIIDDENGYYINCYFVYNFDKNIDEVTSIKLYETAKITFKCVNNDFKIDKVSIKQNNNLDINVDTLKERKGKMFTDEDIEVVLPGYDKEKLINELFNKYIDIQNAWMNFDYESLMNLCTDELYNSYKAQLEILKLKNSQNIMDDYKLLDSEIKDIIKENNFITIVVYMKITLYDYVINTKNSNVIRGTKRGKLTNNYEMTFRRLYSNDKSSNTCPSCGANIKNINSRICPYCKNIIIKNNEDFVLCKKVNKN